MTHPPQAKFARLGRPEFLFLIGFVFVLFVPLLPFAPWLETFIHGWRTELAVSVFLLAVSTAAWRSASFAESVSGISRAEVIWIILPIASFTLWSLASALWAPSVRSAVHHSLVWASYLAFYVFCRWQLRSGTKVRTAEISLLVVVALLCIPPVVEYYSLLAVGSPASIGLRYSKYAEVANAVVPLVLVAALRTKRKLAAAFVGAVVLIWLFDIGTLRRTAVVVFPVAVVSIAVLVFALRRFRSLRRALVPVAVAVVIVPLFTFAVVRVGRADDAQAVGRDDWSVETSDRARPFFARIGVEMFKSQPLTGVGADNYGQQFNLFAKQYAAANPSDRGLSVTELGIPERAHNEYVQILAELGTVGALLFAWLLIGVAWLSLSALTGERRLPLRAFAALIGVGAFLASSMVSSYSFRLPQNGLVFFFLLSIAVPELLRSCRRTVEPVSTRRVVFARPGLAAAMVVALLLGGFSLSRGASVYYCFSATSMGSGDGAEADHLRAIAIDPENATSFSAYGGYLLNSGRSTEAASQFRRAIDLGRSTPVDYSYLATAYVMANDRAGAREALAEAVGVYPFSLFLRSRYSVVLADMGETTESERQFHIAAAQNDRAARSWRNLIAFGADRAGRIAFEQRLPAMMELQPTPALYAMVMERELRFPEERSVIPF